MNERNWGDDDGSGLETSWEERLILDQLHWRWILQGSSNRGRPLRRILGVVRRRGRRKTIFSTSNSVPGLSSWLWWLFRFTPTVTTSTSCGRGLTSSLTSCAVFTTSRKSTTFPGMTECVSVSYKYLRSVIQSPPVQALCLLASTAKSI